MSFIITTDSACDLTPELFREHNIVPMMMTHTIDGEDINDTMEAEDIIAFYNKMRAGKVSKTSQINMMEYVDFWTGFLNENKPILHITLGSAISGTYDNALRAVDLLKETHPEAKVYVLDSISASLGEGLLSLYAANMRAEGKSFEECIAWLEDHKHKAHAYYTTSDLTYLQRGGRVSKTVKNVAHLLGIQPILNLAPDGKLQVFEKARGDRATLNRFCEIIESIVENPEAQTLYVNHSDNFEKAKLYAETVKERLGFKDICYTLIGTTIGTHAGPGLVALYFLGKERF